MKKTGILIVFVILSRFVFAQTAELNYYYDEAGNRIRRTFEILEPKIDSTEIKGDSSFIPTQGENNLVGDATTIQQQVDLIQKYELKVFPNPTEGQLKLVIGSYDNNCTGEIRLYQQNGSLLWMQKSVGNNNIIDLSDKPAGTYLLELLIEGKGVQWKIIKK